MKPLKRSPVNKYQSAQAFKHNIGQTKAANVNFVMRGGIRL